MSAKDQKPPRANRSKSYSITLAARLMASARGILAIILEQHFAQILGRRPKSRLRLHIGSTKRDDAVLIAKSKLLLVDRGQLLEGIGRETVGREKKAPIFLLLHNDPEKLLDGARTDLRG